jgi:hypothetical protein
MSRIAIIPVIPLFSFRNFSPYAKCIVAHSMAFRSVFGVVFSLFLSIFFPLLPFALCFVFSDALFDPPTFLGRIKFSP